ncbi:adenosine deaminase [Synechococcus sp. H65.1]|uniref:adenosine deaminase n=1 Tax=unclassified Synechococcus TaxID=2626047 RepID=UPI0039C2F120
MALHAELHRHLGGSVVPRILWRYLHRHGSPLAERFPDYAEFEEFYTRPRNTLEEYLELHTLVEQVQTLESLPYFIYRLIRGAYVFEDLAYLEIRYTPYLRTDPSLDEADRLKQMRQVIEIVGQACQQREYPIITTQIVCLHSRLPSHINRAMVEAAAESEYVSGIDLAGGDKAYRERLDEWIELFKYALARGLKTTAHLYETLDGCYPELLPYVLRIGHGIQIPLHYPELLPELARRGQCLEVCPTTYLKTGTLPSLEPLKIVFDRCFAAGVDIAICTDNAGLHNVRLPFEYENLLTHDIIDFEQLKRCQEAAFRHAFAWPYKEYPALLLSELQRSASASLAAL